MKTNDSIKTIFYVAHHASCKTKENLRLAKPTFENCVYPIGLFTKTCQCLNHLLDRI